MKIQRTIPPAASPIGIKSLMYGIAGFFSVRGYSRKLEDEIKDYFGVKHVFLVSSGKAALTIILEALKSQFPRRNKVLIPAYTCFSVPSAIAKAGLKVSLCDIDFPTFDFDYKHLERAVSEDTLCVIPTHLLGIPVDIDRVTEICKGRGVVVVEDAAQAMGGTYRGRMLGTSGDVGFFSLGRGKNITCGSGGIVVTNSEQIAGAITQYYSNLKYPDVTEDLKDLFQLIFMAILIHPSLFWLPPGLPFLKLGRTIFYRTFPIKRLSGMKAGLLYGWQRRLEESNKIRRENAAYFCKRLKILDGNNVTVPFLRLPLILENMEIRDVIYFLSNKKGLGISKMYPTPVNEIDEIRSQFDGKVFPFAEKIAECLLTLPTHHFLSETDKEKICSCLNNQWRSSAVTADS